jgi:hypothetical protein
MLTIDTYLSVDLDYWGSFERLHKTLINKFIERVVSLNVPVHVVISHEEILPRINNYKIKNLVNIDYHADIVDECGKFDLNEGTWANFYKYRKKCNFIWHHPMPVHEMRLGRCDSFYKQHWHDMPTGFKSLQSKYTLRGFNWADIREVCFAISPEYLCTDMNWLRKKHSIFSSFPEELFYSGD